MVNQSVAGVNNGSIFLDIWRVGLKGTDNGNPDIEHYNSCTPFKGTDTLNLYSS